MIVTAMILRFGLAAENLAWFIVFLLAPVSAVYYPVSILPGWLQVVAHLLPSSYVFEGMRRRCSITCSAGTCSWPRSG